MAASHRPPPSAPPNGPSDAIADLQRLESAERSHAFWACPLLSACEEGVLTKEDFRFVFSQYYLYSKNFTRYIAALMANLENDLFRAYLTENLWEESGGIEPEKRHAQIFRRFLRSGLDVDPDAIEYADFARHFQSEFLQLCLRARPVEAAAVLSLATEGIVSRLYEIFVKGLRKAGVAEEHLEFFHIHIGCDDAHAFTLQQTMLSYAGEPRWYETCRAATDHALDLRKTFFDNLWRAIRARRLSGIVDRIQARESLATPGQTLAYGATTPAEALYANRIDKHDILFSVDRLPFQCEVLDPRVVRIPPGKNNERHRHAHETIFYVIEGTGRVLVGERTVDVRPGETVFVPRWAMHQSQNTGTGEMVILAITDFGLTGKAFVGDYDKTARMKDKHAEAALTTKPRTTPPPAVASADAVEAEE
jgi:pyrroloquinoline quinone (PQQ) biosynthesis protein C